MDVLVVGAGMIGVGTALQLVRRGLSVCLVDRREPGRETSYGNAGIIQAEAMIPYPFPRDPKVVMEALLRRSPTVHFQTGALATLAVPLARYWWASAPARHETAIRGHSALIAHALASHEELIAECGAEALVRRTGYRCVLRTRRVFDRWIADAQVLQQRFGVRHQVLDADALARTEPALRGGLAGAIHWTDPVAVADPGELVSRYAARFRELGGTLLTGDAASLVTDGQGWRVETGTGVVAARHAVIALGAWSGALVARLGYRLPLFVKRGYHRHFRGGPGLNAPLLDAERGYVLAPMVQGLRLTTGAELARLGAPATASQMEQATHAARELLDLGEPVEPVPWLGNRPCTPDMLPVVGAAPRHRGLWFNFGHAHQGFTLGPVCGRLMADLIEGRPPLVDPAPYAVERFLSAELPRCRRDATRKDQAGARRWMSKP